MEHKTACSLLSLLLLLPPTPNDRALPSQHDFRRSSLFIAQHLCDDRSILPAGIQPSQCAALGKRELLPERINLDRLALAGVRRSDARSLPLDRLAVYKRLLQDVRRRS